MTSVVYHTLPGSVCKTVVGVLLPELRRPLPHGRRRSDDKKEAALPDLDTVSDAKTHTRIAGCPNRTGRQGIILVTSFREKWDDSGHDGNGERVSRKGIA